MKPLSPEQYEMLRYDGLFSKFSNQAATSHEMVALGWMNLGPSTDGYAGEFQPTPRGDIARRAHQAYLQLMAMSAGLAGV